MLPVARLEKHVQDWKHPSVHCAGGHECTTKSIQFNQAVSGKSLVPRMLTCSVCCAHCGLHRWNKCRLGSRSTRCADAFNQSTGSLRRGSDLAWMLTGSQSSPLLSKEPWIMRRMTSQGSGEWRCCCMMGSRNLRQTYGHLARVPHTGWQFERTTEAARIIIYHADPGSGPIVDYQTLTPSACEHCLAPE